MTAEELSARLAALRAAETRLLCGEAVKSVRYEGGSMEFQAAATLTELRRAIFETRALLRQATGGRRHGGAIVPVFG